MDFENAKGARIPHANCPILKELQLTEGDGSGNQWSSRVGLVEIDSLWLYDRTWKRERAFIVPDR